MFETMRGSALVVWLSLAAIDGARAQPPTPSSDQPPAASPEQPAAEPSAPAAPPAPSPLTDDAQMENLDEEARSRFELGRTFYEAGRFDQAAEEFTEAYRLSGRAQLLYNVYVARRDGGKWEQAAEALRAYLAMVPDAPDRITLRARLDTMEAQIAHQKEQAAQAEEARRRLARPATRVETQRSVVPWVLIGTGGALLAGSVVTGVLANGKAGDLDEACADDGKSCPEAERGNVDSLKALAVTTDVFWSVGAAAAVTGLVLRLTGALDRERQVPISAGIDGRRGGLIASLRMRY